MMGSFGQLGRNQSVGTGFFVWCGNHEFRKVIHIEASPAENAKGGDERKSFEKRKIIY